MSSQASSAGHGEADVRRKIAETGDVDVMISIRSNFFYTRTVPCELWFFDKGKPKERRDQVLMLDARHVYRKVTRKSYDFSPEQLANLTAVVWLYRGERARFIELLLRYRQECGMRLAQFHHGLQPLISGEAKGHLSFLLACIHKAAAMYLAPETPREKKDALDAAHTRLVERLDALLAEAASIAGTLEAHRESLDHDGAGLPEHGEDYALGRVQCSVTRLDALTPLTHALARDVETFWKELGAALDQTEALLDPGFRANWRKADEWAVRRRQQAAAWAFAEAPRAEGEMRYFQRQLHWLLHRFPEARFAAVPGLCCVVTRAQIEAADWSLTPGRYVGVAAAEVDEDFDFEQTMRDIHSELKELNGDAVALAGKIERNFEKLAL